MSTAEHSLLKDHLNVTIIVYVIRRCRRDASEDYFGHVGAVRCMVEGGGDVAFVRHSAPAEVSAGRRREWWARDLLPDDLQLLCPDGNYT